MKLRTLNLGRLGTFVWHCDLSRDLFSLNVQRLPWRPPGWQERMDGEARAEWEAMTPEEQAAEEAEWEGA